MLNMGFAEDVEFIMKQIPDVTNTQVMLFSATMPSWVSGIARNYQKNPYRLDVVGDQETRLATTVTHFLRAVPSGDEDKLDALVDILDFHSRGGMVICFVNTKIEAHWMSEQRRLQMFSPTFLHGDMSQALRDQTMEGLRARKFRVLVATDVASRGIDIEGIEVVVQWSPPRDADTYLHRSGRTGRAGRTGTAVTFFTPGRDGNSISRIARELNLQFKLLWSFSAAAKQQLKLKEVVTAAKNVKDADVKSIQPQVLKALGNITGDPDTVAELPDVAKLLMARLFALLMDTDNAAANQRSMVTGQRHITTYQLDAPTLRTEAAAMDMLRYAILDADPTERITLAGITPLRGSGRYLVDIKGSPEGWEGVLRSYLAGGCTLTPSTALPADFTLQDLNRYIDFTTYLRNARAGRGRGGRMDDDFGSRSGGRFGGSGGRFGDDRRGSGGGYPSSYGGFRGGGGSRGGGFRDDRSGGRRGGEDRFGGGAARGGGGSFRGGGFDEPRRGGGGGGGYFSSRGAAGAPPRSGSGSRPGRW
eukprot:TRINITY_DN6268_c0_g1_i1.p1 TRINITY_DN6268_c0_g1~~TRINITY_DN6268_c0_g1_i1.p1  ORF type:complete len:532 (-),score=149.70 TRINITY_DN6268_c0_g1_i1:247-1842(-)